MVCLVNGIDVPEVCSDHSGFIHAPKVKRGEFFHCHLSRVRQECFWLQDNEGALAIPL